MKNLTRYSIILSIFSLLFSLSFATHEKSAGHQPTEGFLQDRSVPETPDLREETENLEESKGSTSHIYSTQKKVFAKKKGKNAGRKKVRKGKRMKKWMKRMKERSELFSFHKGRKSERLLGPVCDGFILCVFLPIVVIVFFYCWINGFDI